MEREDAVRLLQRARRCIEEGNEENAAAILATIPPDFESAASLSVVAALHVLGGRSGDARRAYEDAVRLDPGHEEALIGLAELYRASEDYEAALASYELALEVRESLTGLAGRAEALRMLGRYEEALTSAEGALRLEPTYRFALRTKASSLTNLRHLGRAAPLWRHLLDLDPDDDFAAHGLEQCRLFQRER